MTEEEHIIREHLARHGFAENPISCFRRDPGPVWMVLIWDLVDRRGIVYLRGSLGEVLRDIAQLPPARPPAMAHDKGPG